LEGGTRSVSGLAVRVKDAAARQQLRRRWYAEEVGGLVNRMLLLLVVLAALLFVGGLLNAGPAALDAPTGETPRQALVSLGLELGLWFVWPLVLLALLRFVRWPQLLRTAGLVVLAVTTARGLTVMLAHGLAARAVGAPLAGKTLWFLVDPIEW